jgi:hypothetical protein
MSLSSARRKIQRLNAGASDAFHAETVRRSVANPDEVRYLPKGGVAQQPIRAIFRPTIEPAAPIDRITLAEQDPATPRFESAPAQTGAPVSVTGADYRALPPDTQTAIRAQALNFEGARDRIKNRAHGVTLTLSAAFFAELDYQASMQRTLAKTAKTGVTDRVTKTQSKIDKKAGRRPLKPGGTASFTRGTPMRVTIEADSWAPPVVGRVEVRKLRRFDYTLLQLNAKPSNTNVQNR